MATLLAGDGSKGQEKAVHGFSGRVCEACGAGLPTNGRGRTRRFCGDQCRAHYHSEARRLGGQVIRRRRAARTARPVPRVITLRPDLDAGLLPSTHLARSVRALGVQR